MSEYDAWEVQKTLRTDMLYATVGWEILSERRIGGANECDKDFLSTNLDGSLGRANDCDKNFNRSWGGIGDGGEEGSCKGEGLHIWRGEMGFL